MSSNRPISSYLGKKRKEQSLANVSKKNTNSVPNLAALPQPDPKRGGQINPRSQIGKPTAISSLSGAPGASKLSKYE